MIGFAKSLFITFALTLFTTAACAERRVALVLGNSAYQPIDIFLPNPVNDASDIGQLFGDLKYDNVIVERNLNITKMRESLVRFSSVSEGADIAVIYFAGHGVEIGGKNYLLPIDFNSEPPLGREQVKAVDLDELVGAMRNVHKLKVVLLDACRDNPFIRTANFADQTRSLSRGLGRPNVQAGTIIAYAAQAGTKALDGGGRNSPFARAILRNLGEPNLDIQLALRRVRDDVLKFTGGVQEPAQYASLGELPVSLNALNSTPGSSKPEVLSEEPSNSEQQNTPKVSKEESKGNTDAPADHAGDQKTTSLDPRLGKCGFTENRGIVVGRPCEDAPQRVDSKLPSASKPQLRKPKRQIVPFRANAQPKRHESPSNIVAGPAVKLDVLGCPIGVPMSRKYPGCGTLRRIE